MKNIFNAALVLSVLAVSTIVAYGVMAWTEPALTPPSGNVAAPINIGSITQTKSGSLNIASDTGSVGIGTTSPTQKLDTDGYVKGRSGLCIGNGATEKCCDTWEECVTLGGGNSCKTVGKVCSNDADCCTVNCVSGICAAGGGSCKANGTTCSADSDCCSSICKNGNCQGGTTCKDSMAACTSSSECCSGACLSGNCSLYFPCSGTTLPAGSKKIFVTSNTYDGLRVEATADIDCQNTADAVKLGGTFKALVYAGNRDINQVFPSGNSYWNGSKSGTTCAWNPIANNMADFFTAKTGGRYLTNPIVYNEQGVAMPGLDVWTNFAANGSGGYSLLPVNSGLCDNSTYYSGGMNAEEGLTWYGNADSPNKDYSYTVKSYTTHTGHGGWAQCNSGVRALYCIQQ